MKAKKAKRPGTAHGSAAYTAAVARYQSEGLTRARAISRSQRENPEAHRAWVNEQKGTLSAQPAGGGPVVETKPARAPDDRQQSLVGQSSVRGNLVTVDWEAGTWHWALKRAEAGEADELIKMLRTRESDPPPKVRNFLADILSGKRLFHKKGRRSKVTLVQAQWINRFMSDAMSPETRKVPPDWLRDNTRNLKQAQSFFAKMLGISIGTLRDINDGRHAVWRGENKMFWRKIT